MTRRSGYGLFASAAALGLFALLASSLAPGIAAGALLHPSRRAVTDPPPPECEAVTFSGEGVTLRGGRCGDRSPRRGTLVFLHGIADNRTSVAGAIRRFVDAGLEVSAYDSRAQGESTGLLRKATASPGAAPGRRFAP